MPPGWGDQVFKEAKAGAERINRISYELCALGTLRERLRTARYWARGGGRFGIPEEDLHSKLHKINVIDYSQVPAVVMEATGQPFTGLQRRLKSPGVPTWFGSSIKGDSLGSAFPNSSFEVNAGTRGDGV